MNEVKGEDLAWSPSLCSQDGEFVKTKTEVGIFTDGCCKSEDSEENDVEVHFGKYSISVTKLA